MRTSNGCRSSSSPWSSGPTRYTRAGSRVGGSSAPPRSPNRDYAKFLRHATLVEAAPTGFSGAAVRAKMRRIQQELPGWVRKSGKQAQAMPLVQKLDASLKGRKWLEADKLADELLSLMEGETPG